jgi:hypothetical protein
MLRVQLAPHAAAGTGRAARTPRLATCCNGILCPHLFDFGAHRPASERSATRQSSACANSRATVRQPEGRTAVGGQGQLLFMGTPLTALARVAAYERARIGFPVGRQSLSTELLSRHLSPCVICPLGIVAPN